MARIAIGWFYTFYPLVERSLPELASLEGRVALVTGAAQGFGFACARRLLEAGAAVVLTDRRADRLAAAVARLSGSAHAETGDVSNESHVERLVAAATRRFGRLDVLVNNAGVFSNYLLERMSADEFRRILSVNVGGAFLCTRAAAAQMRAQGG